MLKKDTLVNYIISILGMKTHSVPQGFVPKEDGSMEAIPAVQPYTVDWGGSSPPDELKHLIEAIAEGVIKHIQKDAEFSFNTVVGHSAKPLASSVTVLPGISTAGSPAAQVTISPGTAVLSSFDMLNLTAGPANTDESAFVPPIAVKQWIK
ncbi:MAG: hypothetical protein HN802_05010 [Candidatus Jacksonbacteria bacterium]|jgi:hypothetical protein|nr:hypothetical protein [Candidatus Jacksonbacteria bacterium]